MFKRLPTVATRAANQFDRRSFLNAALSASAAVALPAGRAWSDAASDSQSSGVTALTHNGELVLLSPSAVSDFRSKLRGQLLLARDEGYEQARKIWNGVFDRHPALIARCAGSADVVAAVNFARTHNLLTAVRGGGHSISGQSSCEGGLMIDLAPMRGIRVDPKNKRAEAQAGVLLGDLDRESQAFGLATTLGTASDTGIAGLTLGGGFGRLARKFGYTCDNLRSADIVTADGKLLHLSDKENADLFWAIRGGGGNFGIVTNFEYQLHTFGPKLLSGNRAFPIAQARSVALAVLEMMETADDDLALSFLLTENSPAPDSPPGLYIEIELIYTGELKNSDRVMALVDKIGKPIFDDINVKTYLQAQQGVSGAAPPSLPPGLRIYSKSGFIYKLSDKLIDEMLRQFTSEPEFLGDLGFSPLGGAPSRVKPEATAFWNRHAKHMLLFHANWMDGSKDATNIEEGRRIWKTLEPYTQGHYVNAEPNADEWRLRATYGDNYPRLVALKTKYDPTNLFRLNANIHPSV